MTLSATDLISSGKTKSLSSKKATAFAARFKLIEALGKLQIECSGQGHLIDKLADLLWPKPILLYTFLKILID